MKARFIVTIDNIETGEVAEVPEDTLEYLEGVIESAIETDRRVGRILLEDTDLGDGWEITATRLG